MSKGFGSVCCGLTSLIFAAFTEQTPPPSGTFTSLWISSEDLRPDLTGRFTATVGAMGSDSSEYFQSEQCSLDVTRNESVDAVERDAGHTYLGKAYRVEAHGECPGPLMHYDGKTMTYDESGATVTLTPYALSAIVAWDDSEL
jgi:hypothetical protein